MPTITVDTTSQRYTSRTQPEPDVLLLHTTEGMSWPGYQGGGTAPHDTIKAIPGKGIIVRRHYPYDQYSKSLEDRSGGVLTNKRGVIQQELMGTCDPRHRGDPAWYYWPDADDVVLQALADYDRPLMAQYGIPHKAMGEFVAYPASYGDNAPQRLTFAQWTTREGICGHQHAPENAHGDPGNFPIAKFIRFLDGATTQEDDVTPQDIKAIADEVLKRPVYDSEGNMLTVGQAIGVTLRNSTRAAVDATIARQLAEAQALKGQALTAAEVQAAAEKGAAEALDAKIADATTILGVKP